MKIFLTMLSILFGATLIAAAPHTLNKQQKDIGSRNASTEPHAPSLLTRAETKEAERRLSEMGYWTGPIDGVVDPISRSALVAFQKWEGRQITGELSPAELDAIRTAAAPAAKEIGYEHVEVDLDRQVLLLVSGAGSVRVLPVSSGNGRPFTDEGETSVAYTPRGRFLVYRKSVGWQHGSLGSVYYPNDISGGIAIHGSRNVPTAPASHGCIRIPMFAAVAVSKLMPLGTIVLVYDKVSFVSGKDWAANAQLKEAALRNISITDDADEVAGSAAEAGRSGAEVLRGATRSRSRRTRAKMIRA